MPPASANSTISMQFSTLHESLFAFFAALVAAAGALIPVLP
jgi:hypothetical protein